jgi:hypothetical protein
MRFMIGYVVKNANKVFASENQDVDCLLRAGAAPFNDAIFAFRWVERGRESVRERERKREKRERGEGGTSGMCTSALSYV